MTDNQKEILVRNLDALQIPYQLIPCDPELADTAIFVKHYDYAIEDCANTIVVKSKSGEPKYAACVVLAHCRLDVNHTIRKKLGARRGFIRRCRGNSDYHRYDGWWGHCHRASRQSATVGGQCCPGSGTGRAGWVKSRVENHNLTFCVQT